MKAIKNFLKSFFIDGLGGMATGLFATLIVGTILEQVSKLVPGSFSVYILYVAALAKALTGAGIAVGVSCKLKADPLVTVSAAGAGMVGAFASKLLAGSVIGTGTVTLAGPGEPMGAFLAAFAAVKIGMLLSGKTKIDILVTPILTLGAGSAVGLLLGPPISSFMGRLGDLIVWGTQHQPLLMGIIVSVIMGMCLTLPISSAALGLILNLNGLAGGAAVVGCCAQMVGFAVASYRENKFGGLIAQGLGTSMLQMPNIVRKPIIWLPAILTSAILGPISTCLLKMTCLPAGAGMGTAGLVGSIMTYQSMAADGVSNALIWIEIIGMHFVAPALLTLMFSEFFRKCGWIKKNDMKLDV